MVAMVAISILILPFMYILSILIKVNEVFSIGAIMSIITLVFLWIIYILYYRLKERKLLATGITFLFTIPFTFLINITLSKIIGEPTIDVWDILSVFILFIMAVAFIIGDHARKKVMSDKLFSELYEKNVSYRVDNKQGKATAFPSFVIYSFHDLVENMVLLTLAPLCPVS